MTKKSFGKSDKFCQFGYHGNASPSLTEASLNQNASEKEYRRQQVLLRIEEGLLIPLCWGGKYNTNSVGKVWSFQEPGSSKRYSYPPSGYLSEERWPQHINKKPMCLCLLWNYTQYSDSRFTLGVYYRAVDRENVVHRHNRNFPQTWKDSITQQN